jgi:hypothetical protein
VSQCTGNRKLKSKRFKIAEMSENQEDTSAAKGSASNMESFVQAVSAPVVKDMTRVHNNNNHTRFAK